MKLELVEYTCANCATSFDAPALGESAYGEFLLWSKNGKLAYLNAFRDLTYKQVDNLLAKHSNTAGLQPLERAKILRRIYGELTCDLDEVNSPFEIGTFPPCPSCGSQRMASWQFKTPADVVDISVQPVTHNRWSALTEAEQLQLLDTRVKI